MKSLLIIIALVQAFVVNAMETKVLQAPSQAAHKVEPGRVVEYFKVVYTRVVHENPSISVEEQHHDKYGRDFVENAQEGYRQAREGKDFYERLIATSDQRKYTETAADEIEPQLSLFFLLLEKLDSWEHNKRQLFKDALVKKFMEYRNDLPELIDCAQKLIFVRDYEDWSITVLEAAYEVCKLEDFNLFDVACLLSSSGRLDKWITHHLGDLPDADEADRLVNCCRGSYTPLLATVQSGSLSTLKLLLGAGANSNGTNEEGDTALMRAAHCGNVPMLELLLAFGAKGALDLRNRSGLNALYFSIESGMTEATRCLLAAGASIVDISEQEPFLLMAIKRTSPEVVALLLRAGADTNALYCGMSMLSWAIMHFRNGEPNHTILFESNVERQQRAKEVIRLILADSRTNVNVVEEKGATALALARSNLLHDIIKMLRDRGVAE